MNSASLWLSSYIKDHPVMKDSQEIFHSTWSEAWSQIKIELPTFFLKPPSTEEAALTRALQ
jgi:hypothetical protein